MELSEALKSEILKELTYKSKKPPSRKTRIAKLELACSILSAIGTDPSPSTISFATEVVKKAQIFLEGTVFPVMDKLILRIANRIYSRELIEYVRGDDVDVVAGICYVKYKYEAVVDERLFSIYGGLSGEIKRKIDLLFNKAGVSILSPDNGVTSGDPSNTENITVTKIDLLKVGKSSRTNPIFPIITSKIIRWNDFSSWNLKNPTLDNVITLIKESKLKEARPLLLSLVSSKFRTKAIVYNILAYIHLLFLEFQECVFYLDLLLEITEGSDWLFTLHCKLCVERIALLPSLSPLICVEFSPYSAVFPFTDYYEDNSSADNININKIEKSTFTSPNTDKNNIRENKLLLRHILGTTFDRITLFNHSKSAVDNFLNIIKNCQKLAALFIFSSEGHLFIYNALSSDKFISIPWTAVVLRFNDIMLQNQQILSVSAVTSHEKRHWWDTRIRLDHELQLLISEISVKCKGIVDSEATRLLLILEDFVAFFPFEMLFEVPAVRILSQQLSISSSTPINFIFYLLDPVNNLKSTRETLNEYFRSKNFDKSFISGVVGRSLEPKELAVLNRSELFMYFGHGTGKRHFDITGSRTDCLFLFGCSSCRLLHVHNFRANGFCLRHMGKRRLLGNLWDVTDKDLDRFTVAFLNDFFDGKDILEAIYNNRKVCKLRYLNSAALVMYGYSIK